jgi:hypothetical protein
MDKISWKVIGKRGIKQTSGKSSWLNYNVLEGVVDFLRNFIGSVPTHSTHNLSSPSLY